MESDKGGPDDYVEPAIIPVAPIHGAHANPNRRYMNAFLQRVGVTYGDTENAWKKSWRATQQRNATYTSKSYRGRRALRDAADQIIKTLAASYREPVSDRIHESNIDHISKELSRKFLDQNLLIGDQFKVGSAQKAFNLYLKYLWCFDMIVEPPQCPLDAVVQRRAKVSAPVSWTTIASIGVYRTAIQNLRTAAEEIGPSGLSLAEWELRFGWT